MTKLPTLWGTNAQVADSSGKHLERTISIRLLQR